MRICFVCFVGKKLQWCLYVGRSVLTRLGGFQFQCFDCCLKSCPRICCLLRVSSSSDKHIVKHLIHQGRQQVSRLWVEPETVRFWSPKSRKFQVSPILSSDFQNIVVRPVLSARIAEESKHFYFPVIFTLKFVTFLFFFLGVGL